MVLLNKYASRSQPDVASLLYSSVNYRLDTWKNEATGDIECALFTVGADGQKTFINSYQVRDGTSRQCDCPRVVAGGRQFIIFWLEHDASEGSVTAAQLHRSVFDTNAIATGPVYDAAITAGVGLLYDVCVDESGSSDDIFVAISLNGSTIQTLRYDSPYTTTDTVFNVNQTVNHVYRVLGCSCHVTDDNFVVHYQATNDDVGELWTFRVDAADGTNFLTTQTTPGIATAEYTRVGSCWLETDVFSVVAEYISLADLALGVGEPSARIRSVASVNISGVTTVIQDLPQDNPGLYLMSRPWRYRNGTLTDSEVYVAVGWKSIEESQEHDQSFLFICSADIASRRLSGTINDYPLIPVAALTDNSSDSRPGNWSPNTINSAVGAVEHNTGIVGKRMNHMSHVSDQPSWTLGPDLKSRVFAYIAWERLVSAPVTGGVVTTALVPVQASVREFQFNHEDPWLSRRDVSEPTAPTSQNIKVTAPWSNGQVAVVAGMAIFNGGVMKSYEGRQMVEHGFLWAPEIWDLVAGTAGALQQETYYYCATYAWVDNAGQLHRSRPSTPVTITLTGVDDSVDLYIRTMTLSMRDNPVWYPRGSTIYIEVWRTTVSGGAAEVDANGNYLFRRIYGSALNGTTFLFENTPANDRTAWGISLSDSIADSSLVEHELLPWQLNTTTLQWTPTPHIPSFGCGPITVWNNRVWTTPPNERVIRYSDEILPLGVQTLAPEFLETNTYRIDDIGEVTAMHPMDNQLIIFTRDAIYSMTGEGNDGTGTGATLSLQVLARGTGCIEPRSVVLGPPGLFFQAEKGYYLLNRELQLDYLTAGAPVDDIIRESGNVLGATLLPDREQIRLVLNYPPVAGVMQPRVLVYDYYHRKWAEIPLPGAYTATPNVRNRSQAAIAWRGIQNEVSHMVLEEGGLLMEDQSRFYDETPTTTPAIPIDVQTEWIHLSGISGLKRVWEILVNTERLNDGPMSADLWYDVNGDFDESAPDQTVSWASPAPDVLRIRPNTQKISSFMLRVYESGSVPNTENVRLVSFTLVYGTKPTQRKLPASMIGT